MVSDVVAFVLNTYLSRNPLLTMSGILIEILGANELLLIVILIEDTTVFESEVSAKVGASLSHEVCLDGRLSALIRCHIIE